MPNDLIITGIPRSGTSYICSIFNMVENTVVINEPDEVLQILHNSSNVSMLEYYGFVRDRIKNNLPVMNKIVDGKFIEDTNVVDVRSEYLPNVNHESFILGTKNTQVYLSSLDRLKSQLEGVVVVACVRHPVDTIASWSNVTFSHLKNADPSFLTGYADEDGIKAIKRVLQKKKVAQRYAMWWNYLAKILIKQSSNIVLIRYEDMVVNPQETIDKVYAAADFPVNMLEPIEPSSPRSFRDKLSSDVIDSINEYCKNSAAKLGYQL